jgi:hypothetical protein
VTGWILAGGLALFAAALVALVTAQRSEIRFLRAKLSEKVVHERRVERATVGLPEIQPEPSKPDEAPPAIRQRIDDAVGMWGSPHVQNGKLADVGAWRREGRSWEWIATELENELADDTA